MDTDDFGSELERVASLSDLFRDVIRQQPELIDSFRTAPETAPVHLSALVAADYAQWPRQLRRYRRAMSAWIIWRDLTLQDDLPQTLARISELADHCLTIAHAAVAERLRDAHGTVRDAQAQAVDLVIFGLGKLGGGELNFSSDVDLVMGYAGAGDSDGARPLNAETYFTRMGQQIIKLLDEVTADSFCHRVDMRLRPYGNSGRLVWTFAAMELYFQNEGRDWERYAWQKARPVAGDVGAGNEFLELIRPFIYRRYLDFTAVDGMRGMKASIQAEVARRDRADNIKRGPGGIREIEFLVQALQLIRGGRDATLRTPRLQDALQALVVSGELRPETAAQLWNCYMYLRILENRIQMLRDEQTHDLPATDTDRERVASGMGYDDWAQLTADLDVVRTVVQQEFNALLAPREQPQVLGTLQEYWLALPDGGDGNVLRGIGYADALSADTLLRDLIRGPAVRQLSTGSRARFDRVMQVMIQAAGATETPLVTLRRLIALMQSILRRSAYLALLDEQPTALNRLVIVVTQSALMSERLTLHPLLLDELLDTRVSGQGLDRERVREQLDAIAHDGDIDLGLRQLNEIRQIASFRTAMAFRDRRIDPLETVAQLAWLGERCVATVLDWVRQEMRHAHGDIPSAQFAVVGYGSVGAHELNFGSDLDLVFLFDADPNAQSDGARSLDATRYFARLTQKLVAYLAVQTPAGRLYDVDMRLRPDGAKGLLVSSFTAYAQYQNERAWTWEHQALVRSRSMAGDDELQERFMKLRADILQRPRDAEALLSEVQAMRTRMRKELDRSTPDRLDLKQGRGGLVDLEFHLQRMVLEQAHARPTLLKSTRTIDLLESLGATGELIDAYLVELSLGLHCGLDRRQRLVLRDPAVQTAADAITVQTPEFSAVN